MQAERRAVEHELVLAADLVDVDQRQVALGDARDRDVEADVVLVAPVGRAVRHDQQFGAGLGQASRPRLVVAPSVQMSSQIGMPRRTPRKFTGPGSGPGANTRLSSNTP